MPAPIGIMIEENKGHVVSNDGSDKACHETGEDLSKNQGDVVDARLQWADAVNRLEPDR